MQNGIQTSFTDWRSGLIHYGIPGMKWGVRRFQNEDGSLTPAGQRRIARTSGNGYLNPSLKDQRKGKAEARKAVAKNYTDEYWKKVDKGMPTYMPSKEDRDLWNKYKDRYASATLKDLKMKDTREARRSVKNVLKQIDYEYQYRDPAKYDPSAPEAYLKRKEEIAHPVKTKAKKKVKAMLDAASTMKKLIT